MFNEIIWKMGEDLAAKYMIEQGFKIVYRNFKCKIAELDIVAILSKKVQKRNILVDFKEKIKRTMNKNEKALLKFNLKNHLKTISDLLVITEVKARSNGKFGKGYDAISQDKITHLKRGAEFLLKTKQFKNMQVRFDVASVDDKKITYIENAF